MVNMTMQAITAHNMREKAGGESKESKSEREKDRQTSRETSKDTSRDTVLCIHSHLICFAVHPVEVPITPSLIQAS